MRELVWQIQQLNGECRVWNILGYVDKADRSGVSDIKVSGQSIPYLGGDDFLLRRTEQTNAAICVGNPSLRKKIAKNIQKNPHICFPNLILGNVKICSDVQIGKGCIISMDARISTNVALGDFVFLNMGSGICHDGKIGNYVTLSPDVRLAGNVTVEEGCDIGMGAKIIQGRHIGANAVIGAGSVVITDIAAGCMAAGAPAKEKKKRNQP